jgi:hypothetical protein
MQGIRFEFCTLLVKCGRGWCKDIHIQEIQQPVFRRGRALRNQKRDKLIGWKLFITRKNLYCFFRDNGV